MGEWNAIRGQADCDELLKQFGAFHDGCVRELHAWTGHFVDENLRMACEPLFNLRMLVQRQCRDPSAIELLFEDVVGIKWIPAKPNYEDIIFEAWLFISQDAIVWSLARPEEYEERTHVSSRKLWWREVSEWMGDEPRYCRPPALPG